MKWQDLQSDHGLMRRAKVPGGWFVMYRGEGIAMVFYPDLDHKWDGHSEKLESTDLQPAEAPADVPTAIGG